MRKNAPNSPVLGGGTTTFALGPAAVPGASRGLATNISVHIRGEKEGNARTTPLRPRGKIWGRWRRRWCRGRRSGGVA